MQLRGAAVERAADEVRVRGLELAAARRRGARATRSRKPGASASSLRLDPRRRSRSSSRRPSAPLSPSPPASPRTRCGHVRVGPRRLGARGLARRVDVRVLADDAGTAGRDQPARELGGHAPVSSSMPLGDVHGARARATASAPPTGSARPAPSRPSPSRGRTGSAVQRGRATARARARARAGRGRAAARRRRRAPRGAPRPRARRAVARRPARPPRTTIALDPRAARDPAAACLAAARTSASVSRPAPPSGTGKPSCWPSPTQDHRRRAPPPGVLGRDVGVQRVAGEQPRGRVAPRNSLARRSGARAAAPKRREVEQAARGRRARAAAARRRARAGTGPGARP